MFAMHMTISSPSDQSLIPSGITPRQPARTRRTRPGNPCRTARPEQLADTPAVLAAANIACAEAPVGSGSLATGDTAGRPTMLEGGALLGAAQGSAGSDVSSIPAPAHPPAPQAWVQHLPVPQAMPLPPTAFPWGDAGKSDGPSVAAIMSMRDATLRAEVALRVVDRAVLLAAGSAPHRREVRGILAFAADASAPLPSGTSDQT